MKVIYLKCGGRLRVWRDPGIVASLLGAIRIQLIMMIYDPGYYVRGRTKHFLWGMIINTTQSPLTFSSRMWQCDCRLCQVWLTHNVITPRSRKLGSKFLLLHGTVAHFYLFVPFLCLHLSWPPVQIRKKLIGFLQAGEGSSLLRFRWALPPSKWNRAIVQEPGWVWVNLKSILCNCQNIKHRFDHICIWSLRVNVLAYPMVSYSQAMLEVCLYLINTRAEDSK